MAAATRLETPLRFAAQVVKGFQRGSKELGWPTANLEDSAAIRQVLDTCELGVYCGWATVGPASPTAPVYKAAVSVGWNPTYTGEDAVKHRMIEPYLLYDFEADFYGCAAPPRPSLRCRLPAAGCRLPRADAGLRSRQLCSRGSLRACGSASCTGERRAVNRQGGPPCREPLRLVLCGYIRPEKKFDGETWLEDLKAAITADVSVTESTLSQPAWEPVGADAEFLRSDVEPSAL